MNDADKAFVEQSQKWIENQKNSIAYNEFLMDMYTKQIAFLKEKIELEFGEKVANQKTLKEMEKQLAQFIQERD